MIEDRALEFFREATSRHSVCCSGDVDDVFLHSADFDSSFGVGDEEVCIEAGIRFGEDRLSFYWIFDNDHTSQDVVYAVSDPYPENVQDEAFWSQVEALLQEAAGTAWASGVRSCPVCGCHYHQDEGACCTPEGP